MNLLEIRVSRYLEIFPESRWSAFCSSPYVFLPSDILFKKINNNLNTFYGHTFERIALEMVSRGIIPIPIDNFQVNKFWHKDVEIDGVATNDKNDVVFVEIKFVPEVDGIKIYNELKYKSLSVNIKRNKEYYMIIDIPFNILIFIYQGKVEWDISKN